MTSIIRQLCHLFYKVALREWVLFEISFSSTYLFYALWVTLLSSPPAVWVFRFDFFLAAEYKNKVKKYIYIFIFFHFSIFFSRVRKKKYADILAFGSPSLPATPIFLKLYLYAISPHARNIAWSKKNQLDFFSKNFCFYILFFCVVNFHFFL